MLIHGTTSNERNMEKEHRISQGFFPNFNQTKIGKEGTMRICLPFHLCPLWENQQRERHIANCSCESPIINLKYFVHIKQRHQS